MQTIRQFNEVFEKYVSNERTVRRWFLRSSDLSILISQNKLDERHESNVDNYELKVTVEVYIFQTTRKLAACISTIFNHLKHIDKIKMLDRWDPTSVTSEIFWNVFFDVAT